MSDLWSRPWKPLLAGVAVLAAVAVPVAVLADSDPAPQSLPSAVTAEPSTQVPSPPPTVPVNVGLDEDCGALVDSADAVALCELYKVVTYITENRLDVGYGIDHNDLVLEVWSGIEHLDPFVGKVPIVEVDAPDLVGSRA